MLVRQLAPASICISPYPSKIPRMHAPAERLISAARSSEACSAAHTEPQGPSEGDVTADQALASQRQLPEAQPGLDEHVTEVGSPLLSICPARTMLP